MVTFLPFTMAKSSSSSDSSALAMPAGAVSESLGYTTSDSSSEPPAAQRGRLTHVAQSMRLAAISDSPSRPPTPVRSTSRPASVKHKLGDTRGLSPARAIVAALPTILVSPEEPVSKKHAMMSSAAAASEVEDALHALHSMEEEMPAAPQRLTLARSP